MKRSRKASLLLIVAAAALSACNATPSADSAGKDAAPASSAASPAASAAAPAPSAEAAIDVVKSYYASAAKTSPKSNPNIDPATFAPDLLKAFAAEAAKSQGEVGAIEFDIRSGSQDPAIKDLSFTSSPSETGAVVVAHFVNNGQKKAVAYVLETIDGQWKIANIKSDGEAGPEAWDVKSLLASGS